MAATTLVGLYFVSREGGPAGGVVAGHLNHETLLVRVLSEETERTVCVPVAVAIGWEFFGSERDALCAFGRVCREALCL